MEMKTASWITDAAIPVNTHPCAPMHAGGRLHNPPTVQGRKNKTKRTAATVQYGL